MGVDSPATYFVLFTQSVVHVLHTAAPTGHDILAPDDAVNVLEEILEAQNQAYVFGLKLPLPQNTLDAICHTHSQARDRLHQVIIEFLQQVEPRPT